MITPLAMKTVEGVFILTSGLENILLSRIIIVKRLHIHIIDESRFL